MDNRLKIAIVGVGWAGSRHAEAIAELRKVDDRVEVDCFVDSDPEHLQETAAKYGVSKIYPSLENDNLYRPVDQNDPDIQALAKSIKAFGLGEPLVTKGGFSNA